MKKINHILFIDDDEMSIFLHESMLRYSVEAEIISVAKNGLEALEFIDAVPVDIILLDLNMPDMNGFQFLKALKQLQESAGVTPPPVVIISSSNSEVDIDRAAHYPIVKGFFTKPLTTKHVDYLINLVGTESEASYWLESSSL